MNLTERLALIGLKTGMRITIDEIMELVKSDPEIHEAIKPVNDLLGNYENDVRYTPKPPQDYTSK